MSDGSDEETREAALALAIAPAAAPSGDAPAPSRRRRRRRTRVRASTTSIKRMGPEIKADRFQDALWGGAPASTAVRPATWGECREAHARPCPWVSCKHHLYLDVNPETGSIKINFPDLEPWELGHTCALDVAERGGITLEEVGEIMNLTRERIRQVERIGLHKAKGEAVARGVTDADGEAPDAADPRAAGALRVRLIAERSRRRDGYDD